MFQANSFVTASYYWPLLAEVSERIALEMGVSKWECSNGFLERFKKHHNTVFKVAQGEAASVALDNVDNWVLL